MKPAVHDVTISFRLPERLLDRLERRAVDQDRPMSYLIRKAIEEYLRKRKAA